MITLRIKTNVQNDRRVVVTLPPEVPIGPAELVVSVDSSTNVDHGSESTRCAEGANGGTQYGSALEFLESLPFGPRAFETWEEYERHLEEEKAAWER